MPKHRTPRTIHDSGAPYGGDVGKRFDVNDITPEQQPDSGQEAPQGRWPTEQELPTRAVDSPPTNVR
jgi:hypothetical protein